MSSDARLRALSALARFEVAETTVGDTLLRIAEITLDAVPTAAAAGFTVLGEHGRPTTAVYTDELSPVVDQAQYDSGRGPCLDAWRAGRIVRVDHLDTDTDEYPEFAAACRSRGIASTLSLPIVGGGTSMGALNLYATTAAAFDAGTEDLCAELALAAGSVVANVSAYWTAFELSQHLTEAMESRAIIEQAKGILMAQSPELDADGAFALLSSASQRENVKVRDIARRIVDRRPAPSELRGEPG